MWEKKVECFAHVVCESHCVNTLCDDEDTMFGLQGFFRLWALCLFCRPLRTMRTAFAADFSASVLCFWLSGNRTAMVAEGCPLR